MDRLRAHIEQMLAFFRKERVEAEMDEEMQFHLEKEVESNLQAGMNPEEARRQALLAFGGTDWNKERIRDERGGRLLEDVIRDLRFGLRNLRKRPVFALAAILTLSVGIGMTATMFTLVDAVVLRPLPGSNAQGLVYLELETEDGQMSTSPSPQLLRLVRDHASSFTRIEAYATEDFNLMVDGEPLRGSGARASTGFFDFLGVRPALGRGFVPDDGLGTGNPVVVLSHTLWAERFGEDRGVPGRTMGINGRVYEIIGVLPRDFRVDTPREALFWIPEGSAGELFTEGIPVEGALAQLAEGVTPDVARAELDAIVRNNPLEQRANLEWIGKVHTPGDLIDPSLRRAILISQAAALLVLLIACGNLANLLLAQGETRARELALRASLGAGRGRLVRQLLVESLALGAFGGIGGILLTIWALQALPLFLPPGYGGFALNGKVFLFASGVSILSVLGAGLLPALKGSKRDLAEVIKGVDALPRGPLRRVGVRQLLVTAEVAMAFVLLVSAGLLLKSFAGLMAGDVGFDRRDLLVLRLDLPEERYADAEAKLSFFDQLQDGIRTGLPDELGSATLASGLVEDLAATFSPLVPEGSEGGGGEPSALILWGVDPDYFDVVGVPLLQGRGFREEDGRRGEEVVIISENVARRYFPDADPVGRRVRLREDWYRVVGVSGSVQLPVFAQNNFGDLQLFFPFRQDPGSGLSAIARVRGDRAAAIDLLKEAIWGIDSSLPILDVSLSIPIVVLL
ncbi:ABC transporter permease, partial [Gemmatimonadota bacterium]